MAAAAFQRKLRILPGQKMLLLNHPSGYVDKMGELPEGSSLEYEGEGPFDFVHVFVHTLEQLKQLGPAACSRVKLDGILWVSYPKLSSGVASDLQRDLVAGVVAEWGLRAVTQVSIDEVWSAIRFRPAS